ncbi:uncharacterized protein LOC125652249 [Ostrea edulis]|uniref:uncharacterized protein LOC125652249 n=1 Tax=Ostrea edulis TaxID=37623 RepID=UPI0024AFAAA1|nr:uncharacterized protein LOC125652249 [Ostrea edulis]
MLSMQKLFILIVTTYGVDFTDGNGEACGTIGSGTQLYCPDKYHCCDSVIHSCCEDGYVCWKSVCISIIPLILVPCVVVVVVIATVVVKIVKKRKIFQARTGGREPASQTNYANFGSVPVRQHHKLKPRVLLEYLYSFIRVWIIHLKLIRRV